MAGDPSPLDEGRTPGEWTARARLGSAAELHALDLLAVPRSLWRLSPDRPAIVLGSAQHEDVVDDAAARAQGLTVCRRRSGGGVVRLDPEGSLWVDVVVAVDDPRWDPDVHRAFEWLGDAWVAALREVGVEATIHRGAPVDPALGRLVCFAGIGAGEVLVGGAKVVGISQRRDRRGSRFQCVAHRRWDPADTLSVLGPAAAEQRDELERRLTDRVGVLPEADAVLDSLTARVLHG
jgi:lipoate---protein ligase